MNLAHGSTIAWNKIYRILLILGLCFLIGFFSADDMKKVDWWPKCIVVGQQKKAIKQYYFHEKRNGNKDSPTALLLQMISTTVWLSCNMKWSFCTYCIEVLIFLIAHKSRDAPVMSFSPIEFTCNELSWEWNLVWTRNLVKEIDNFKTV